MHKVHEQAFITAFVLCTESHDQDWSFDKIMEASAHDHRLREKSNPDMYAHIAQAIFESHVQ